MVQPGKIERVEDLKGLLESAKSIVLNDFTGLNVKDISELRKKCRENNVTFKVVKNTLAKRAIAELRIDELEPMFEGPTAIAVSAEDEVAPAQVLKKFADDYELPRLKGGYIAGHIYDAKEIERLASLPSKEVLLAQVVGTMQAPLRGLVTVLDASPRGLVQVLNAIAEKRGAA
ncbi:MAG: 50S ribosomal protein L10 [Candidatus Latescibacteria bacterium 4484_7]|nr:MAG: 50S ribosomal protein L10 [Candidatus Latescibacteria bacterium 4484_7]RKZ07320.1 MAG: 50S ribosomal protein L10 [bacterium]